MRIKRFNEKNEQIDISSERTEEMIGQLKEMVSDLDARNKTIESLNNELNNFVNNSQKGNDQIDDSIFALQEIKKSLDNSINKIDTIVENLESYNNEGRKYLYTENK